MTADGRRRRPLPASGTTPGPAGWGAGLPAGQAGPFRSASSAFASSSSFASLV